MKAKTKEIKQFIQTWQNQGSEVADKVTYWNTLLEILGVPKEQIDNKTFIDYEKPIKLKENEHFHGSIDAYIPSTKVLIEQKSYGVDLFKEENRPNGHDEKPIKPFDQARRYDNHLPSREKANFLVLSNFSQIVVYDVRDSIDVKPLIIELKDLKEDLYLLDFLVKPDESKKLEKEQRVSVTAGELIGKIYDELSRIFAKYDQTDNEKIQHSINALCVRLVFCLYAEDANLFVTKEQFYNYLEPIAPNRMGVALKNLFDVLDTKEEDRTKTDPFWKEENPELAQFPYVNGGLFRDKNIIIPPFTPELKEIVLNQASRSFDWSAISPTIFGAVFESTLNPDTRRHGGMHYTSVKNIHRVIDPLFLNDLKAELESIKQYKNKKTIKEKALAFQDKLSKLTFFDPACGSGNFLTETYLSLRRLENEAIRLELGGESVLDVGQADDWIQVSIQQFFGIEINDFAVSVAKTALWIAEDQMMKETQDLLYDPDWNFLPLKTYTKIHEGDALRIDWNSILPNYACHYVISNPPFVGQKQLMPDQRADMTLILGKKHSKMDFVVCWYMKAINYVNDTDIKVAFVSTNSITQGEQATQLGQRLLIDHKCYILFAYQTFVWKNDTKNSASVHVVIVGFSSKKPKIAKLYQSDKRVKEVKNINQYLLDAPTIIINGNSSSICNAPKISRGCQLIDGGNFVITKEERKKALADDKNLNNYIFPYYNAHLFLNTTASNHNTYCIYLEDCDASTIRHSQFLYNRVKAVKLYRKNSKAASTKKLASQPSHYFITNKPVGTSIIIPVASSKNRDYIPMGYEKTDVVLTNALFYVDNATLYHLGVLESIVHMAWMRTVAGRLKSDFRYSTTLVYNSFPWPSVTDTQKEKISQTAQAILDARALHPDSTLADLYDQFTMPVELRKAHEANDKAVLEAYGLPIDTTESEIVAHLFKMYEKLTRNN